MSRPTPFLDLFKRGEVTRDVRMQAAEGALAPNAHEQVEILLLLAEDADAEIRAAAETTIGRIPSDASSAKSGPPCSTLGTTGPRGVGTSCVSVGSGPSVAGSFLVRSSPLTLRTIPVPQSAG